MRAQNCRTALASKRRFRQSAGVLAFDALGFATSYEVEVEPEFPGDGAWRCPAYGYNREGQPQTEFDSRWGSPLVVRIEPRGAGPWIAMFAAGGLGTLRAVCATPDEHCLVAVADGLAYLVDTRSPGNPANIAHDPVDQVVALERPALLLLVRFIDIVAIGTAGVAWTTRRLCVDGLHVEAVTDEAIVCSCENLDGSETIRLDPGTGEQTSGTDLRSSWPPDALAQRAPNCRDALARVRRFGQSDAVPALHELIAEHGAAPFPQSVEKGRDYGEVDAVMIGADIYGWALRAQGGGLSSNDRNRLQAARDSLARSLLAFPDEARPYYAQLVALADAALE